MRLIDRIEETETYQIPSFVVNARVVRRVANSLQKRGLPGVGASDYENAKIMIFLADTECV